MDNKIRASGAPSAGPHSPRNNVVSLSSIHANGRNKSERRSSLASLHPSNIVIGGEGSDHVPWGRRSDFIVHLLSRVDCFVPCTDARFASACRGWEVQGMDVGMGAGRCSVCFWEEGVGYRSLGIAKRFETKSHHTREIPKRRPKRRYKP